MAFVYTLLVEKGMYRLGAEVKEEGYERDVRPTQVS